MPDDQNIPQDITTQDSIPTTASEPTETPPDAQNAPANGFTSESQNMPLDTENAAVTEPENQPETPQNPENVDSETSETQTAQTSPNEPLDFEPGIKPEPIVQKIKPEPAPVPIPVIIPPKNSIRELLEKAKNAIQFRKRKKLDKIMAMFLKKSKITNDEVEKYLHVSDATAERYLNILEKENKIKQVGKTGKAVSYSRI